MNERANEEVTRCAWCTGDPLYVDYHDTEWGVPEFAADELFERLILEGMQAGLSWLTVLKKREQMRKQFFGFDRAKLAVAGERDVSLWLQDAGLIRHRGKLQAMIGNARLACEEDDFVGYLWEFAPTKTPLRKTLKTVPSTTKESELMSKSLKKKGYRFVGPTICYAFMQSVGMVNDHIVSCWQHGPCAETTRKRPAKNKR